MKLILGMAGSGKTTTVAQEVAALSKVGKDSRILTDEVPAMLYMDRIENEGGLVENVSINYYRRFDFPSLVSIILADKTNPNIFVDCTLRFSDKDLDFLLHVEEYTGKAIHVCVQSNHDSGMKESKMIERLSKEVFNNGNRIH